MTATTTTTTTQTSFFLVSGKLVQLITHSLVFLFFDETKTVYGFFLAAVSKFA